jgi:hypothetical protein
MGSAFVAETRGGQQFRGWDLDRYFRARQIDATRALQYTLVLAHMDPKKKKPNPPEPVWVPDKTGLKPKKVHKPGSFAAIALARINAVKKLKERGG